MATELQKNLAVNIVKNAKRKKPLNKQELVVSSGYSEISADRHATEIIEQKGVQEELSNLGFSTEGAKKVVAQILYKETAQDKDRLKAADMVFEVHGDKAADTRIVFEQKIIRLNVE